MVSGVWRRLRSAFGRDRQEADRSATTTEPGPTVPAGPRSFYQYDQPGSGPAAMMPPRPTPARPSAESDLPQPVEAQAESLRQRLVEDEGLRGSLTDEEFRPLLDWALIRIDLLCQACSSLPAASAAVKYELGGGQLLSLLRTADLAIGQRSQVTPELAFSRLQMLDTFVAPPLFEQEQAELARARLETALNWPAEQLRSVDGLELACRVAASLG